MGQVLKKQQQVGSTGRRKTSSARVFLRQGSGKIIVNGKPLEEFFGRETARMVVKQPLVAVDVLNHFDFFLSDRF